MSSSEQRERWVSLGLVAAAIAGIVMRWLLDARHATLRGRQFKVRCMLMKRHIYSNIEKEVPAFHWDGKTDRPKREIIMRLVCRSDAMLSSHRSIICKEWRIRKISNVFTELGESCESAPEHGR